MVSLLRHCGFALNDTGISVSLKLPRHISIGFILVYLAVELVEAKNTWKPKTGGRWKLVKKKKPTKPPIENLKKPQNRQMIIALSVTITIIVLTAIGLICCFRSVDQKGLPHHIGALPPHPHPHGVQEAGRSERHGGSSHSEHSRDTHY